MNEFGFLSVLLSIILGLAATEILQGLRRCLLARQRVNFYWPVVVFAFLFLLIVAQVWWTMFGLRDRSGWTFAQFAIVLGQTVLVYMLAGLTLPDFPEGQPIDLKRHYYEQHRWFGGLLAATLILSICKDLVLSAHLPSPPNIAFHSIFFAFAVGAAVIRREWFHKAFAVFALVGFVLYIGALFARLR